MEIVAVSGLRDVLEDDHTVIARAIDELLAPGTIRTVRFGGARGSDTVALRAARRHVSVSLEVIVPGHVDDQPEDARAAIYECADNIIELGLPASEPRSYLRRNDALLDGPYGMFRGAIGTSSRAHQLVAFTDGRRSGGTAYTIRRAETLNIPVRKVMVRAR